MLTDAGSSTTAATTLFGVVQKASTFFRSAYKRMVSIGETGWLSKSAALVKIFGSYSATNSTKSGLFAELILAPDAVADKPTFQESVRSDAKVLMDHFMKFETILAAFVFLQIYKVTTPD